MPIITTLEITRSPSPRPWRSTCSACQSWATISPVVRLRLNPWCPVEQKRQPTAQPACEEMHRVPRSSSGMKTVSTALPPPTSNSHFTVPSAEACSLMACRPDTWAQPLSFSRRDFARSLIWSKSLAPRWWIQRNSCVARKRFSPSRSQKAAMASRSRSRRFVVITSVVCPRPQGAPRTQEGRPRPCPARGTTASARVDVQARKEEGHFDLGGLGGVGAVHGVGVDAVGKVGADRAGIGLLGVGRAHEFAVLKDGILAFQHLHHHGAGDHEVHQVLEEGALLVHAIELLGLGARQVDHAGSRDLQAGSLETGVDLADHILGDCIGLDDGKGTFDSHVGFPRERVSRYFLPCRQNRVDRKSTRLNSSH